ncbi:unnamed protein product [Urochloa humidicola]
MAAWCVAAAVHSFSSCVVLNVAGFFSEKKNMKPPMVLNEDGLLNSIPRSYCLYMRINLLFQEFSQIIPMKIQLLMEKLHTLMILQPELSQVNL